MNETDAVKALAVYLPIENQSEADAVAKTFLQRAIYKVGTMSGPSFNRKKVEFTLTAGKSEYQFGVDLMVNEPAIWRLENFYRTDVTGWPIFVVPNGDFEIVSAGSTTTGAPQYATLYGTDKFAVWPSPDQAYTTSFYAKVAIDSWGSVPPKHQPSVIDIGAEMIQGVKSPGIASKLAEQAKNDIQRTGLNGWHGDLIQREQTLGARRDRGVDSHNLTGE